MRSVWSTILGTTISVLFATAIIAGAEPRTPKAGRIFYDCSDCPVMVVIPPGSFLMGSSMEETQRDIAAMPSDENETDKLSLANEHPQHPVTIGRAFGMGRYPVTRGEFAAFVQEASYTPSRGCALYTDRGYITRSNADWLRGLAKLIAIPLSV
jgi:formylglycine-generating enzyme required for sulfatase activity